MASGSDDNYNNTPPPIELPEDILIEIFLRSCVESLLCAKSVCKYWYGLIKDPKFAHRHLHYQKHHMKKDRLLIQYLKEETLENYYTILDDKNQAYQIIDCMQATENWIYMDGPINGLYCLYDHLDRIVLWNPALMDLKTIPLPPSSCRDPRETIHYGVVGFGMDPLTNDCKVVLILSFFDYDYDDGVNVVSHWPDPLVSVYSLSTNSWRLPDLGDFRPLDLQLRENESSSFLGGTYYWWSEIGKVVAFHMGEETFRVIPAPNNRIKWDFSIISVYEDRLVLLLSDQLLIDIWVMVEEGMWIKQFSIGPIPNLMSSLGFFGNKSLVLILQVSEIAIHTPHSQIVLYDLSSREMRNVGPRADSCSFRTCVYYESLVSVDGGTICERKGDLLRMVSDFFLG